MGGSVIREIMALVDRCDVTIEIIEENVFISSVGGASLSDAISVLRPYKKALVDLAKSHKAGKIFRVGPPIITPSDLPLVALTQDQIDGIVETVPGGSSNIQDIYPLAPLQEGILFHHLLAEEGDPYVLWSLRSFADRALLDRYVAALNGVVARHDILRTAIIWEGLAEAENVMACN